LSFFPSLTLFEIIQAALGAATAVFAAVLVRATFVLARVTRAMDEHEMQRRREQDLRNCIQFAQTILSPGADAGSPMGDLFTSKPVQPYNDLLSLGKYFHDVDTKRQLEVLTSRLTAALVRGGNPFLGDKALTDARLKLRERLVQEIVEWQRDLGNYQRS